jgi:hypothetical protein
VWTHCMLPRACRTPSHTGSCPIVTCVIMCAGRTLLRGKLPCLPILPRTTFLLVGAVVVLALLRTLILSRCPFPSTPLRRRFCGTTRRLCFPSCASSRASSLSVIPCVGTPFPCMASVLAPIARFALPYRLLATRVGTHDRASYALCAALVVQL